MAKYTALLTIVALFQTAYGCASCGGHGIQGGIIGDSGVLHGGIVGGAIGGTYGGAIGGTYGGAIGGAYTYPGTAGVSCTPVTTCSTGTCARPVTVCRTGYQTYPCTSCTSGLSCTPTCSC